MSPVKARGISSDADASRGGERRHMSVAKRAQSKKKRGAAARNKATGEATG